MNNNRKMIKQSFSLITLLLFVLVIQGGMVQSTLAQDRLPVREYTNPDEMVTFDRTTSFTRALDVVNEFAQENVGKIIIDRTSTESPIEISIPPMHWRDALDLILRVKGLQLIEQQDFFEIVRPQPQPGQVQAAGGEGGAGQQGEEVVATIDTREVRINAIFFEGNRRALQEIGVDWSTLSEDVPANLSDFVGSQQGGGGGGEGQLPSTGFSNQFVSVNAKGAQNVSQSVFNSLINFGEIGTSGIEVQALFSAFEADNLGEILASPTVKVMDGQEGSIQVGQDFSIKQRDFAGNVTDQFFSTGTILTVTPTIIEQNDTTFIHLDITAEKSSAQPDPVSTIVNKQEAVTQALLVDGEATAIAGLYSSESSEVRRGIPILKDLPAWFFGLRYLFGYNSTDYAMRELVILVQAEIEPTIAERYGEPVENKFKLLNEERELIRKELREREKYSPTDRLEDGIDPTKEKDIMNEQDSTEEPAVEPTEDQTEQEDEMSQVREKPDEMNNQPPVEEDSTSGEQSRVVDPEIKNEPVPLNLGSNEQEMGQNEDSKEMAAKLEQKEENQEVNAQPKAASNDTVSAEVESAEETAATDQTENQDDSAIKANGTAGESVYYIIGSSFTNEENAVQYREKLAQEGFDPVILLKPDSDFHFVAYRGYSNLEEAKTGLADIREYYNSKAWIYRKQ